MGRARTKPLRLGSIDLLESRELVPAFTVTGQSVAPERRGVEATEPATVKVEDFDLIVMNPPFTRSVGGNLLFGALPQKERGQLQRRLAELLKKQGFSGIGQAGLGAVFVAVADKYLKKGARLALVIPRSLVSGVAWRKIRELLTESYEVELIVASHQAPNGWNFSENTDLSEVLLIARKDPEEPWGRTIIANLWRKPANEMEAIILSRKLVELNKTLVSFTNAYDMLESTAASHLDLNIGETKFGEAYTVTEDALPDALPTWGQLCPFAQSPLNRIAYLLVSSGTVAPIGVSFPLLRLDQAAERVGPDRSQVHGSFHLALAPTTFRAFWEHDSSYVTQIALSTNRFLQPKPGAMKQAQHLWDGGRANLMVAERLRLNTNKLVAVYISEEALSNVWWPVRLQDATTVDGHPVSKGEHEQIQALWLNSTFGLLGILTYRQDTEGAWVGLKKETLGLVPLLDLSALRHNQVEGLLGLYQQMCQAQLPPLPVQFEQAAQKQGWRYELDRRLLGIIFGTAGNLAPIYEMLAREPIICLRVLA